MSFDRSYIVHVNRYVFFDGYMNRQVFVSIGLSTLLLLELEFVDRLSQSPRRSRANSRRVCSQISKSLGITFNVQCPSLVYLDLRIEQR
jgi:hypothetical protein